MGVLSGGSRLEAALSDLARKVAVPATLRVGFLEGARYPDGTPVAMVAATQNFGAPAKGIPPRPFFSNMIAAKSDGWGPSLARILERNGYDAVQSLELLAEGIKGQLREAIVATNSPPNAMATNLLKNRFPMGGATFGDVIQAWRDAAAGETAPAGKPLVWSGHMLNSVDSEVSA
jgi:hypothetical protein